MVQVPMHFRFQVWEALRCHAARHLKVCHPATFGGLGDGVDGMLFRAALRVASNETETSLLHGLLMGALWTLARVGGRGLRMASTFPFCGATKEDEAHVLWDCP